MKYLIVIIALLCSLEGFTQIKKVKEKKGKYGFVMKQGGKVEYKYDEVKPSWNKNQGYKVRVANYWGFVNNEGKEMIACDYDSLIVLLDGAMKVKLDNKWGILNEKGKFIVPMEYEAIEDYTTTYVTVQKGGKWGVIKGEKKVIECQYDSLRVLLEGDVKVKLNDKWGIVDNKGNVRIPIKYEAIATYDKGGISVKTAKGWGGYRNDGKIDYNTDNFIMPEIDEYPIMESCVEVATTYEDQKICSDKKMMMYIYQNIQYPDMARTAGVEGTVVVSFSIDKQGNVKDLSLIRNPGYGCGAEVLRIINIMVKETNWIAGKKNGQPVICRMNRPVRFRLN